MLMKSTKIFVKPPILFGCLAIYISMFSALPKLQLEAFAQRSLVDSLVETTPSTERDSRQLCQSVPSSYLLHRTELFFGSLKPDSSDVTDAEFLKFLNYEVTPKFPEGLTLLTGQGQFRNSQGAIVKERSRLLILLYSIDNQRNSNKKIEQIRQAYKANFQQESVLRTDSRSCVSF
jgi:Protein of unknown function (DUF3574)